MVVFVDVEELEFFLFAVGDRKRDHGERVESDADFVTHRTMEFAFELAVEVVDDD